MRLPYYFGDLKRDPILQNYPHAERVGWGFAQKVVGIERLHQYLVALSGLPHGGCKFRKPDIRVQTLNPQQSPTGCAGDSHEIRHQKTNPETPNPEALM